MPRCIRTWVAWLVPALLLLMASPASAGASRLALVVGNAAYPARPLATTANDAALVAQALAQAGFDVTGARDLDAVRLRATLAAFVDAARAAGPEATLFVYLAGYGVQYGGGNFFVPVDARLIHDDDVPAETASLDEFVRALAAVPAKARLVVADANRTQPFATADEMPLAPGLAPMVAPAGTIVAAAAAPGMVSSDDALPYGAYARALAETIAAPGLSPNLLFDRIRLRVGMLTNGGQVPWDDGNVADDAAPTPAAAPAPAMPPLPQPPGGGVSPDTAYSVVIARDSLAGYAEFLRIVPDGPLATRIRLLQAVRREATIWQAAAVADDPRAAWTIMRRYPRGPHRFDARRRLAALHAALEPPPRFDPFVFPALPPPTPAELPLLAAPESTLRALPPIPPPPAALLPPADPAYYDELPMPSPARAGLLPIAPPLPGAAAGEPGRIRQAPPGRAAIVSETQLAPGGSASITLADATGPIVELVASEAGDTRTLIETGPPPPPGATTGARPAKPKADVGPPVLSRTHVTRTADGVTIIQADGAGTGLSEIATSLDADGARTTRVTNGRDETVASWRRDAQGIVVGSQIAGQIASAASAAPAITAPARPPPAVPSPPAPSAPTPAPRPAPRPVAPPVAPSIPAPSIPVAPAAPPRAAPAEAAPPPTVLPQAEPVPVRPAAPSPAPLPLRPPPVSPTPTPILPKLAPPAPEPPPEPRWRPRHCRRPPQRQPRQRSFRCRRRARPSWQNRRLRGDRRPRRESRRPESPRP